MNHRLRFHHGVIVAALLAILAAVAVTLLTPFLGLGSVIRLTAPLLALAYLLFLFRSVRARTGRVVTLSAWGVMAVLAWWFAPSLPFYLLLHVGAIWLIRSIYVYSGLLQAALDFALSTVAVLTFAWAFMRTGSVFLATWCFFLLQSLWPLIPRVFQQRKAASDDRADEGQFERARRQADAALRQLFSQ
jgi:hypothetical protein